MSAASAGAVEQCLGSVQVLPRSETVMHHCLFIVDRDQQRLVALLVEHAPREAQPSVALWIAHVGLDDLGAQVAFDDLEFVGA